ncbi:calcium-binding protein [Shimia abyssi]|uniref:Hemolysin type calcium-binding protein n=1 Tax=Shimia abyssi TaxID=1662395 RepID=A0A2P8FKC5_9RHOB|nr:calcium-binding protein [Shimia abyssi]PSL22164.1 hypothetical protein CLV88_101589 [Shimia abyssi]
MTTRSDLNTYVNATMDREQIDPDGNTNKRFDTKTKIEEDANNNDSFLGSNLNDYVSTGIGNDYVRTRKGDDHVAAGDGNDVVKLGRGDDEANGGDGRDFLMGGRGNDRLGGGAGDDYFGAVNGSNLVSTGDGHDTIVLTYRQSKMEARDGNATADDWAGGSDAYTTVTDFTVGEDVLHMTGLNEGKAPEKLLFDVSKKGTMITDQDGNAIVYLRDVQVEDAEAFIADSMDFGKFDWKGTQLRLLSEGEDAPGKIKDDGSMKNVDFKDKVSDYGVFDYGENDLNPAGRGGQSFFYGSDGSLSQEARAVISGSTLSEGEVEEFVFALLDDKAGVQQFGAEADEIVVTQLEAEQLTFEVNNGNTSLSPQGATDTVVLRGEVVEDAIRNWEATTGLDSDSFVF